jgi:hypothetical protein
VAILKAGGTTGLVTGSTLATELVTAFRGSDMAGIGDTGVTACLIWATAEVTEADTPKQDTPCMEPAWGGVEQTL